MSQSVRVVRIIASVAMLTCVVAPLSSFASDPSPVAPPKKLSPAPGLNPDPSRFVLPPLKLASDGTMQASNFWPDINENVTLQLTIRNQGTATVANIPWTIQDPSASVTLQSGIVASLPPSASATVTAQWHARTGQITLVGTIDPDKKLGTNQGNGTAKLTLSVPMPGKHFFRIALAGTGTGRVIGSGLDCYNVQPVSGDGPSICALQWDDGTDVTLQAYPGPGSTWAGWSSACSFPRNDANGRQICETHVGRGVYVSAGFNAN